LFELRRKLTKLILLVIEDGPAALSGDRDLETFENGAPKR